MNMTCQCDLDKNYSKWEKDEYYCVYHLEQHTICPYCICPQCEIAKSAFENRLNDPIFRNHLKNLDDDPILKHMLKILCVSDSERSKRQLSSGEKSNISWITVSFADKPVPLIIEATASLFAMKFIAKYEYVFEQRGKAANDIHGIHIHALIWSDYPTWKVKQWIAQKLMSPKYGVIANNKFIDAKKCPIKFIDDKRAYMTGTKDGEDKQAKQQIDIIFRQKYNLLKIYKNT